MTNSDITIQLKRSFFDFFKKQLIIDSKKISYGKESMFCPDAKEVRYGITQLYINGIKANRIYEIAIKGKSARPMRITFQSLRLFFTNKEMEETYNRIISSLWENITKRLVNEALQGLENGKPFVMENFEVHPKGIKMRIRRWFLKKEEYFVEWKNLRKYASEGLLVLYSEEIKKAKIKLNFQKDWNTPVLASLLDFLFQEGRAYKLAEDKF